LDQGRPLRQRRGQRHAPAATACNGLTGKGPGKPGENLGKPGKTWGKLGKTWENNHMENGWTWGKADEKPREKVERLVEHGRNMVQQCSTYLKYKENMRKRMMKS
jgi:hypothetical protein